MFQLQSFMQRSVQDAQEIYAERAILTRAELDCPFTMNELREELNTCHRTTSLEMNGITFNTLANLGLRFTSTLIQILNHIWGKVEFRDSWKMAKIVAMLKPGKSLNSINSFQSVSLPSCVGKII